MLKDPTRVSAGKTITFLAVFGLFLAIYLGYCWVVFENNATIQALDRAGKPDEKRSPFFIHNARYYRSLARKLQYYPHQPAVIERYYKQAVLKGPADYQNFLDFANYLSARHCCPDRVARLYNESLLRYAMDPQVQITAGYYYLTINEKQKALPYLRRGSELNPMRVPEVVRLIVSNHGTPSDCLAVIPPNSPSLLALRGFLSREQSPEASRVQSKALDELSHVNLGLDEKLAFARWAFEAQRMDIARKQAILALNSGYKPFETKLLLAEIAWKQRNIPVFEKYMDQLQKGYIEAGKPDQAARAGLETAMRIARISEKEQGMEMLKKVVERYPEYAPAYEEMARFSRNFSNAEAIAYLKKAAVLNPENARYQKQLAEMYLASSEPQEAAEIFQKLLDNPDFRKEAYIGLAQCKMKEGETAQAISVLERALNEIGNSRELLFQLARAYSTLGDHRGSAEAYLRDTQIDPERPEPYVFAGDEYIKAGQYEEARKQYQRALNLQPQNARAKAALLRLQPRAD